jgi:hypothetical protein
MTLSIMVLVVMMNFTCFNVMLSVDILNVVILSIVMLDPCL